jgi:hypothetical protein
MKFIQTIGLLIIISVSGFGQSNAPPVNENLFFIRGGFGTSWITLPKVFLLNPVDTSSVQILPTTNSFTGYIGFQAALPLGEHWLFMPELDINYIAGEIRVDRINSSNQIEPNAFSQKLQSYIRIELPLNFGVISSDNFWVSFGPVLFFTIADNKGFDNAVHEIENPNNPVKLNSDNPVSLRFRLAAYVIVGKGMYIDVKFDSDLNRKFFYTESDDTYNMKMSMQSVTIGFGYRLNRAGL